MMKARAATVMAVALLQLSCGDGSGLSMARLSGREARALDGGGGEPGMPGAAIYNALCQRVAVRYYPSDLSGRKTRRLCRGEERADATWPAGLLALDERRAGLIAAVDEVLSSGGQRRDAGNAHPARRFLRGLLSVHDSRTSARGIDGLARLLDDLNQPEMLATLADTFRGDPGPWGALAAAVTPDLVADLWRVWSAPPDQWAPADAALREFAGQVRQQPTGVGDQAAAAVEAAADRWLSVAGSALVDAEPNAWRAVGLFADAAETAMGDLLGVVAAPSLRGSAGSELFNTIKPQIDAACGQRACRPLASALERSQSDQPWQALWTLLKPGASSPLSSELRAVAQAIAADPQRVARLRAVVARPAFKNFLEGLAQWAHHSDSVGFDVTEEVKDREESTYTVNGRPGPLELRQPASHRAAAPPEQQSLLRRVLAMVHDANQLTLQNRAVEDVFLSVSRFSFSYRQGEIFRLDNLAHMFLRALAGRAYLQMCLRAPSSVLQAEETLFSMFEGGLPNHSSVRVNGVFGLPVSLTGKEITYEPLIGDDAERLCRARDPSTPWRPLRFRVDPGSASRLLVQALREAPVDQGLAQIIERPTIDGVDFIEKHAKTFAALEVKGIAEGLTLLTQAFVGPAASSADEQRGLDLMVELMEVLHAHVLPLHGPGLVDLEPLLASLRPEERGGPDHLDAATAQALLQLGLEAAGAADRWWARASAEDPNLGTAAAKLGATLPRLLDKVELSDEAWAGLLAGLGQLWLAVDDDPEMRLEDVGAWLRSPPAEAGLRLIATLAAHEEGRVGLGHLIKNLLTVDPEQLKSMARRGGTSLAAALRGKVPAWLAPEEGPLVALGDLVRAVQGSDAEAFVPELTRRLARPGRLAPPVGSARAPAATLAEAFAQVNRRDPAADGPLDAEDWSLVLSRLRDFLRDEEGGLPRFLAIVERRHG